MEMRIQGSSRNRQEAQRTHHVNSLLQYRILLSLFKILSMQTRNLRGHLIFCWAVPVSSFFLLLQLLFFLSYSSVFQFTHFYPLLITDTDTSGISSGSSSGTGADTPPMEVSVMTTPRMLSPLNLKTTAAPVDNSPTTTVNSPVSSMYSPSSTIYSPSSVMGSPAGAFTGVGRNCETGSYFGEDTLLLNDTTYQVLIKPFPSFSSVIDQF